ncbi:MAG: bifunctional pyr operon transcriptional regulator/uracil phosphoribosyltransferase PyrR [Halothiobacillaceae bacterium]
MQNHDVEALIQRMVDALRLRIDAGQLRNPLMVGIHTGGVWVAERLHAALGLSEPLGKLNIAFYRDDFTHIGLHPQVSPSSLPFDVEGRDVILVDDVLQTGRTIRAAMNELFDFGRPAKVVLAVLCDRPGRELPIQADIVGQRFDLEAHEQIILRGPEPLRLTIEQKASEE